MAERNAGARFPELEPNHAVREEDGLYIVVCPFEQTADGRIVLHDHPVAETITFSSNAEPWEIECPRCEVFRGELHYLGPGDHAGELGLEPGAGDEPPPIAGGSGEVRYVEEYQPCRVPLRRISWCGIYVTCHEGIVGDLRYVEAVWKKHGGSKWYPIRQADTAIYVCRRVRGGSSWSGHSWGVCPDLNWQTNPFHTTRCDHPLELRAAFKKRGFAHGLDWRSVKDPMHYSKLRREGGDGKLFVPFSSTGTPATSEEDELDMDQETFDKMFRTAAERYFAGPKEGAAPTRGFLIYKALFSELTIDGKKQPIELDTIVRAIAAATNVNVEQAVQKWIDAHR